MKRFKNQDGQVIAVGVFILIILLLALLAGFDIYNAVRAKFKVETAQEAAALAGAHWQKDSLNLIGEINLIKACAIMLEGDANWDTPLPTQVSYNEKGNEISVDSQQLALLQKRLDLLTEMQTRISFIGPLIGFAAAQQAAKANGLKGDGELNHYIEMLQTHPRYTAVPQVNHYKWREPYTSLVQAINSSGIAVYPNARATNSQSVIPPELAQESFYAEIYSHNTQIKNNSNRAIPYAQTPWSSKLAKFSCYCGKSGHNGAYWHEAFHNPPWWEIMTESNYFPNESEIFPLGVAEAISGYSEIRSYHGKQDEFGNYDFSVQQRFKDAAAKRGLSSEFQNNIYRGSAALRGDDTNHRWYRSGLSMKFFCYDNTWYPEYYKSKYGIDYLTYHYEYWFNPDSKTTTPLRNPIRKKYIYEGPAAYVEGSVDVGRVTSTFRVTGQKKYNLDSHSRIGSRRNNDVTIDFNNYRPGVIAKALGSLDDETPPIGVPLVLPVFDKVTVLPTYMPIPYGFAVLRGGENNLEKFLAWLSTQQNLDNTDPKNPLPAGCEYYLEALRILVKDKEFRRYAHNPDFNEKTFEQQWKTRLVEWHKLRLKNPDNYQYSYARSNSSLPGYLQEPQLFSTGSAGKGAVETPDNINGGTAIRYYYDEYNYFVVDGRGKIVTNHDIDPTLNYSCCCCSPSSGGSGFSSDGRGMDTQQGPPRL